MLTFTPLIWADAGPLYVWRHDPETQMWSLKLPPTWDEHLRWMNKVISGVGDNPHEPPPYEIYRMGRLRDIPAVIVSVKEMEVSITTNPHFRKYGLATKAIKHIQSFGLKLTATIKAGNEASLKLFAKCGFLPQVDQKDSIIIMEWTP